MTYAGGAFGIDVLNQEASLIANHKPEACCSVCLIGGSAKAWS